MILLGRERPGGGEHRVEGAGHGDDRTGAARSGDKTLAEPDLAPPATTRRISTQIGISTEWRSARATAVWAVCTPSATMFMLATMSSIFSPRPSRAQAESGPGAVPTMAPYVVAR
jgi:hypothetical protein